MTKNLRCIQVSSISQLSFNFCFVRFLRKLLFTTVAKPILLVVYTAMVILVSMAWGAFNDLAWYGQIVLFLVTLFLAFYLGFQVAQLCAAMMIESVFKVDAEDQTLGLYHYLAKLNDEFHTTYTNMQCLQTEHAELIDQLEEVQNCLDGVYFIGTINPDRGLRVERVGQFLEKLFKLNKMSFMADWKGMLADIKPAAHCAIEEMLTNPNPFPEKQSLIFPLNNHVGLQEKYLNLVVKKKRVNNQTRVFAAISEVTDLVSAQKQAESNDRAKSEFLAIVSHELRTPLNAIIGFSNYLRECLEGQPELQKDMDNIVLASRSLNVVLNDILDFSTIRASGLPLHNEPFCLQDFAHSLIRLNQKQASEKGLALRLRVNDPPSDLLIGDVNRLRQVMQNLVSNAIKFTEKGEVELYIQSIQTAPSTVDVQFDIVDTGIGLNSEEVAKIFKPFSQANQEVRRRFGGTGLGLAICSELVSKMGGTVAVSSVKGVGSKFTVHLRFNTTPAELVSVPTALINPQQLDRKLHILTVDDHPINLKLLQRILTKSGHHVQLANSGIEAIQLCQTTAFDLILMDIDMPVMDGFIATKKIRSLEVASSQAHICALTGYVDVATVERSKEVGMNSYLAKPLNTDKLDALIVKIQRSKMIDAEI